VSVTITNWDPVFDNHGMETNAREAGCDLRQSNG
jgi:hypothetical protein